jgi:propanediol dehydratase large subunit
MRLFLQIALLALSTEAASSSLAGSNYTAAVYQHTRIRVHDNATATKLQNVADYGVVAARAAAAGVDIIVFPEVGLGSNEIDRAINAEYCEDVPEPSSRLAPCDQNATYCSTRYEAPRGWPCASHRC